MTAEEIARKTALNWWGDDSYPHKADFESLIQEFTKAIEQAKANEREACEAAVRSVRVSHQLDTGECDDFCDFVAAWETAEQAIRNRGK